MKIFTLYNKIAKSYSLPFFQIDEDRAKYIILNQFRMSNDDINDFDLYCFDGVYDDIHGVFENVSRIGDKVDLSNIAKLLEPSVNG